jgi:hypothetical protein
MLLTCHSHSLALVTKQYTIVQGGSCSVEGCILWRDCSKECFLCSLYLTYEGLCNLFVLWCYFQNYGVFLLLKVPYNLLHELCNFIEVSILA